MDKYAVNWAPDDISSAETYLKLVHECVQKIAPGTAKKKGGSIQVDPCGSFLLRTNVFTSPYSSIQADEGLGVDLCVTIPDDACSLDDVQDGSYFLKREVFLNRIKQSLEKDLKAAVQPDTHAIVTSVPLHHDVAKHHLRVVFNAVPEAEKKRVCVNIHCRPAAVSARVAAEKAVEKHALYSQLVLEDYLMPEHLKRFHKNCASVTNLTKVIVFIKCWAAHVGVIGSTCPSSMNGYHLTSIIMKLVEDGIVTSSLSEENMIRAIWVHLAKTPCSESLPPTNRFTGETYNTLHRVSAVFYNDVVRPAAETALKAKLSVDAVVGRFTPLELRYDVALSISGLESALGEPVKLSSSKSSSQGKIASSVAAIVATALGPRKLKSCLIWSDGCGNGTLLINVPNEVEARSRVTVGPAIEDTAAVDAFDAFWGKHRTSTRQFPDGSINRCVSWATKSSALPDVISLIVQTALHQQLTQSIAVNVLMGSFHEALYEQVGNEYLDAVSIVETNLRIACARVADIFEKMPPQSIPCKISSFDIITPSSRSCEPFAARPHITLTSTTDAFIPGLHVTPSIEPIHCVLQIDDKHKIPDTLEAIAMMKGAICAQLSKSIQSTVSGVRTTCTSHSVDVVHGGYLFRVYVAHFREVSLLRALQREAEASFLEKKLFWTVRHSKFIKTLVLGHPSFSLAVRLARRWVAAMMLGDFIAPEVVELLVSDAYLEDFPPRSALRGFVNFLQLVEGHNWEKPLVLPTTTVDPATLVQRPKESAMWILAPYEPTQSPFTAATPRSMILHRLVALARSALRTVSSLLRSGHVNSSIEHLLEASLFTPQDTDFDFSLPFVKPAIVHPDRCLHTSVATEVKRYWQMDELPEAEWKRYIAQLIELEPANQCVKAVRAVTRDRCMTVFDTCGPSRVSCVLLASTPAAEQITSVRKDVVVAAKGALGVLPKQPQPSKKRSRE